MCRVLVMFLSCVVLVSAEWSPVIIRSAVQMVAPMEEHQVNPGCFFLANDSLFLYKEYDYTVINPDFEVGEIGQLVEGYALSEKGLLYFDTTSLKWIVVNGFEEEKIYKIVSEKSGTICYVLTETTVIKVFKEQIVDTVYELAPLKGDEQYKYIHDLDVTNMDREEYCFSVVAGGRDFVRKEIFISDSTLPIWHEESSANTEWVGVPAYEDREVFVGLMATLWDGVTILDTDKQHEYTIYSGNLETVDLEKPLQYYSHAAIDFYAASNRLLARPFPLLLGFEGGCQIQDVIGMLHYEGPVVEGMDADARVAIYGRQVQNINAMMAWDSRGIYHYYEPPVSILETKQSSMENQFSVQVRANALTFSSMGKEGEVKLFNSLGREVLSYTFSPKEMHLVPLKGLSSGVYIVQLKTATVVQSRSIMIP